MKIYDKEIYNKQKNISAILTVLVAFFIGFACGYLANTATDKVENKDKGTSVVNNTIDNNIVENETLEE